MQVDLSGFRALVTGSTKGIGRAISEALAANDAEVVINGRDPASVERAIKSIQATLPKARLAGAPGDVATADGTAAIITAAGEIDLLINNAGIFEIKAAFDIPDEDWQRLFATNVLSGIRLTRRYGPRMRKKGFGRIIFFQNADRSDFKPKPYALNATATSSTIGGGCDTCGPAFTTFGNLTPYAYVSVPFTNQARAPTTGISQSAPNYGIAFGNASLSAFQSAGFALTQLNLTTVCTVESAAATLWGGASSSSWAVFTGTEL